MSANKPDESQGLFAEDHRFDHLKKKPPESSPSKTRSVQERPAVAINHRDDGKIVGSPASVEDPVYLTVLQVAQRYGVSRATIWRWFAKKEGFPAPLALSPGTARWSLIALLEFEETRAELAQSIVPADTKPRPASGENQ